MDISESLDKLVYWLEQRWERLLAPDVRRAMLLSIATLAGISGLELLFDSALTPGRTLSFLAFAPVWVATRLGGRTAGTIAAIATTLLLAAITPDITSPTALLIEFLILIAIMLGFDQFEKSISKTKRQAAIDPLTGLLNRREFQDRTHQKLRESLIARTSSCLILIDCDKFKSINDIHGHAMGDKALQILARAIKMTVPEDGLAGRLGGDEFLVFLPETEPVYARIFIRQLTQNLEQIAIALPFEINMSAGIATSPHQATNFDLLLAIADQNMFQQKDINRNAPKTESTPFVSQSLKKLKTPAPPTG